MSACQFVGRVGGLAVALGVGAALYSGASVAWADSGSGSVSAGPAVGRSAAAGVNRTTASKPAAVSRRAANAGASAAGAPGGGTPATTDAPLDLAAMAYSRRSSLSALRNAAAAADLTQPVIMGPSGVPIPSPNYVNGVLNYYIRPTYPLPPQPVPSAPLPEVVFTPEGLYPITGVKSLQLNTSVDQGIKILYDTLAQLPEGTETTVFGYSQSAIISGLLQEGYTVSGTRYTVPDNVADTINFVLVGNELNPNGGLLSRFSATEYAPAMDLPSLGIPFYGATPQSAFSTTNYTLEYDGFADFPRYPLNLLAVLNAGLGLAFVHTKYVPLDKCNTFCTTAQQVAEAMVLPVELLPGSTVQQSYYFIPTENLPLLEPLRTIPLFGNAIADLIQPVLKPIIDLGYGDYAHGYGDPTNQPAANVLVPFGLFPEVNPLEVINRIVTGVVQGVGDFINAFGPTGSIARELSAIRLPDLTSMTLPTPDGVINAVQNLVTGVANAISYSAAAIYAGLLPTADIANALLTALPAYNVALFLGGIKQMIAGDLIGGLINAIGLPIAATVGLVPTASLVGALVWAQAIAGFFGITVGT